MNERHMLEARRICREAPAGSLERDIAAALEAAERRGVRAGLARAWDGCRDIPAADYRIRSIDPASVDAEER